MRKCVSKPGHSAVIVCDLSMFENGHSSECDCHAAVFTSVVLSGCSLDDNLINLGYVVLEALVSFSASLCGPSSGSLM